jgi:hypothetical protein
MASHDEHSDAQALQAEQVAVVEPRDDGELGEELGPNLRATRFRVGAALDGHHGAVSGTIPLYTTPGAPLPMTRDTSKPRVTVLSSL